MKKVLLIEPDLLSGRLYSEAIGVKGVSVNHVLNAQSALDALDNSLPDCIVLEVDMLNHNGLEFLYEFNSHKDWAETPIVIHSSINPERFKNMNLEWSEFGVAEYLYKGGSSLRELQEVVNSNIRLRA